MKTQPVSSYSYEFTDTFSGEANYGWVRRGTVKARSIRGAVTLAKRALGLENVRCKRADFGDEVWLHPYGQCTVLFIRWEE